MSSKNVRRRQPTRKAEPLAPKRRIEILGIVLMMLAVLLSIAIVTYHPDDDTLVSDLSMTQILIPGSTPGVMNALGSVGAVLAQHIVPNFFGYSTLLLTGFLFVFGYRVMRRKRLRPLPFALLMTLFALVMGATLAARIGDAIGTEWNLYTGILGDRASAWLTQVFGSLGSFVLLATIIIVAALLVMDRDIQQTLERIEKGATYLRTRPGSWWGALKTYVAEANRDAPKHPVGWSDLEDSPPRQPASAPSPATTPEPNTENPGAPSLELKVVGPVEVEETDDIGHAEDVPDEAAPYTFPSIELLDAPVDDSPHIDRAELEENKQILLDKLAVYNIDITSINAVVGPTVTLYELAPAPGVKISRIKALEDDLAMATAARGIRMIAPIPGKSVVGIEIPNRVRELVRLRSIIGTTTFRDAHMQLPVALGKTVEGEVFLQDLTKMPHLLIAGATGSGKSVGLNTLIAGLLYACHPSQLKFVMIDPKKIELQQYRELREHYLAIPENSEEAIITDVADALGILKGCEREMEERYELLSDAKVRSVKDYNNGFQAGRLDEEKGHRHLPYIVVIVDELADLMMTAGKDIEAPIARLAQMARAVGIHLVLATQRPSVDVITGLIKANFPSRVAFQVASKIDARTILDQNGAESLVGNGDMLYMSGSRLLRLQGPFVSVDEVDRIMECIREQPGPGPYLLPPLEDPPGIDVGATDAGHGNTELDDLFDEAARIIVRSQQGSVSLLQRKLSVGYTRAARIVDQLEEAGVVGAFMGSKAREVLVPDELALEAFLEDRA